MSEQLDGASLDLSRGEFQSLVLKAFRGAGYSWGLAEEAAVAARRLASAGYPAPATVSALLSRVDGTPIERLMPVPEDGWRSPTGPICPVCAGATLNDYAVNPATVERVLSDPNLLEPLLAAALTGSLAPTTTAATRVTVDPDTFAVLTRFAHRTYAPATEASRMGAGAGPGDV